MLRSESTLVTGTNASNSRIVSNYFPWNNYCITRIQDLRYFVNIFLFTFFNSAISLDNIYLILVSIVLIATRAVLLQSATVMPLVIFKSYWAQDFTEYTHSIWYLWYDYESRHLLKLYLLKMMSLGEKSPAILPRFFGSIDSD